jgi:molybdate transport system ATP-binding protein
MAHREDDRMKDDVPSALASRVGALVYEPPLDAGLILNPAIALLRDRGIPIGGVAQRIGAREPGRRASIWIDHIETGRTRRLDRPRGPSARSCVLDPDALAEAAMWLRQTTEQRPAVIAVNRFGHTEAEGDGMRAEIAEAVVSGAAVLIAVRRSLLADLAGFLGEAPTLLPADADAIAAWAEQAAALVTV